MQITVRPLAEGDLAEADRVFRLAFGTLLELPDPMAFKGDADPVRTRWRTDPAAALGAYRDAELVGSSFSTRWGTFGIFGPLTVRPDCWSQGIGQRLLESSLTLFAQWGVRHAALVTVPESPKHVALYQKAGFWPQFLTALMSRKVTPPVKAPPWARYSDLRAPEEAALLHQCAALTGSVFPGLDLRQEIQAIKDQGLGDTVLLLDGHTLVGLAACHIGKGSEAGTGSTYVKFGAVRPGEDASGLFDRLLTACQALAAERGSTELTAGVNTARHPAYRQMIERGFRIAVNFVAMQRPNEAGYNRPDCFVIDDWR